MGAERDAAPRPGTVPASELMQTSLGSRVICEDRDLLYEEAPMAYKPVESVIEALVEAGLIRVIATLRPVLTYKTADSPLNPE